MEEFNVNSKGADRCSEKLVGECGCWMGLGRECEKRRGAGVFQRGRVSAVGMSERD